MPSKNNTSHNDEISKHLDAMYDELMLLRLDREAWRKRRPVTEKEKQEKADKILDLTEQIEFIDIDFKEMLKNHTEYWRYKKSTGQTEITHSEELLAKLKTVKSNMGSIVSTVPSQNQNSNL